MSNKHKKVCRVLNYIELSLILVSKFTGCDSISIFASLVDIPTGTTSSAIGLKICEITAGIKNYKSIIKRKKMHDKIVLLAKFKLKSIERLISNALTCLNISDDEFVLIKNVLKEFYDMKK